MNEQRVRRIFNRVGLAEVRLAAVEDEGVSAEIEQQHASAVLAGHAQADFAAPGSEGVGEA
ncbi:MAG: hypothetical protein QOJ42_3898 [Acidobacteriaceae bacterium]|jgi:hypothetical protein|nr:hypothetical protein [Acidobacteriaceae bacterium]